MSRASLGLLILIFTNSNLNANNYSSAAIGIQAFPTIDTIFQLIEKIAPLMFRGTLLSYARLEVRSHKDLVTLQQEPCATTLLGTLSSTSARN